MLHFPQLVFGYALLQGEQIFGFYSVRFIQYLPPTVFAGGLRPKKNQFVCWKQQIMVSFLIRKQKVRLFIVLRNSLFHVF